MHGCGNLNFDVNFMHPSLILSNARLIKNVTVTDAMDLSNPMRIQLNGQAKQDAITIEQFGRVICTKKMVLEICIMDENAAETLPVRVEVNT